MRVTSKGQVTIPKHIRDKLGIKAGDEVEFIEIDRDVTLVAAGKSQEIARAQRLARFDAAMEKWAGNGVSGLSTEQILAQTRDPDLPMPDKPPVYSFGRNRPPEAAE